MLLAVLWIAGTTACDSDKGDDDEKEESSDDDDGESKKKKRKKRKKKKDDDDDDAEEDDDAKPAKTSDPEAGDDVDVEAIRIGDFASGAKKFRAKDKPAKLNYKTVPATGVQIPVAPGWKGKEKGLYKLAISPDGDALLAFTTVGSLGELTGRLKNVEKVFEVNNYKAEGRKKAKLGPDKLNALFADGSCKFGTTPGDMAWVLIDTGAKRKVLVIVAGKKTAAPKTRKQALWMVFNMRKAPN